MINLEPRTIRNNFTSRLNPLFAGAKLEISNFVGEKCGAKMEISNFVGGELATFLDKDQRPKDLRTKRPGTKDQVRKTKDQGPRTKDQGPKTKEPPREKRTNDQQI